MPAAASRIRAAAAAVRATWGSPRTSAAAIASAPERRYVDAISEALNAVMRHDPTTVVIGQDVWERDEALVAPFVKQMGDQMTYRVALDDRLSRVELLRYEGGAPPFFLPSVETSAAGGTAGGGGR